MSRNSENREGYFMLRLITVVAAAAGLLAVGALSAVAGNSHGKAVSALATSTTLKGEARGDAISALASARGEAKSDGAKADKAARVAARAAEASEAEDADEAAETDEDAHGDAVSAVAKSDATAAHTTGDKTVNHGGAVSAVARDHDK